MTGKTSKAKKGKPKKTSKKPNRKEGPAGGRLPARDSVKISGKAPSGPIVPVAIHSSQPLVSTAGRAVFSIEISAIGGDTTIGDLIVAFPRTRDVLMKHGLRFDVEEAGYLYMTLNVFSAIHGLTTNNLVQELHVASKELPPPPVAQPVRAITAAPTA